MKFSEYVKTNIKNKTPPHMRLRHFSFIAEFYRLAIGLRELINPNRETVQEKGENPRLSKIVVDRHTRTLRKILS